MKNSTFYFSHDYNSRNDRKMIRLRLKHKMEGVGVFWCLVEMLYEEGGKIPLSDTGIISDELRVKDTVLTQIIKDFGLFENDGNYFWSESVKRRLDKRLEKSEKAKASASHRWQNANAMRTDNEGNAIKERKGKKRKENVFIPPSIDDVKQYFTEKGYTIEAAEKAFEYYASNDWHDRNGDKVTSWKQKMIANWFKDENKTKVPVVQLGAKKMVL